MLSSCATSALRSARGTSTATTVATRSFSAKAQVTKLPNGVRVVTTGDASPLASVGMVVQTAGSRAETATTSGAAHFVRNSSFKPGNETSPLAFVRRLEHMGAFYAATTHREALSFAATVEHSHAADAARALSSVLQPTFQRHLFDAQRPLVEAESAAALACPVTACIEGVHSAAFRATGLGRSTYAAPHRAAAIDEAAAYAHVLATYSNANLVVVGAGVAHDALVDAAQATSIDFSALLAEIGVGAPAAAGVPPSPYVGGESRSLCAGPAAFAVAFRGAAAGSRDAAALHVLATLLGGGDALRHSRTACSRLNRSVVEAVDGVARASAFNYSYSDAGVFGVYVESSAAAAADAAAATTAQLRALATLKLDADELQRARASAAVEVLASTECTDGALAFLTQQLVAGVAAPVSPSSYASTLQSITADDVAAAAKAALQSPASIFARGPAPECAPTAAELRV